MRRAVNPALLAPVVTVDKYEAVGNDFLVLIDPAGPPGPDVARRLCDRRRGVGADGLVWGAWRGDDPVPATFRLWNADGSQAEMSGNGIRCLVHALADAGLVSGWRPADAGASTPTVEVPVATPAGTRVVALRPASDPAEAWGSVDMGPVTVRGEPDRCNVGHGQLLVDVGNPHLVVLGPDPAGLDVVGLGAQLAAGHANGINVEFVALGPGPGELTLRVFERGVGETLACGTGSVAAAAALGFWGRVGSTVTVHQPGGAVEVRLAPGDGSGSPAGSYRAALSGPSRRVARCEAVVPAPAPSPAPAMGGVRR